MSGPFASVGINYLFLTNDNYSLKGWSLLNLCHARAPTVQDATWTRPGRRDLVAKRCPSEPVLTKSRTIESVWLGFRLNSS
jgi:hypothetical protein